MNEFQKKIRQEIRSGATVECLSGSKLIDQIGVKFAADENGAAVLLKVKGTAFEGRVRVRLSVDGYRVTFLKRGNAKGSGWFYHPVKDFSGVSPEQLTALIDAVANDTVEVVTA